MLERRRAKVVHEETDLLVLRSQLAREESGVAPYDLDLVLCWLQSKGLCAVQTTTDHDAVCNVTMHAPCHLMLRIAMLARRLSSLRQSDRVGMGL